MPLAICEALPNIFSKPVRILMAGFGVGWSWGAVIAEIGPIPPPSLIEMPEDFPTLPLYPESEQN